MNSCFGRPEFIPASIFRQWMKSPHLNKHLEVGGIQPTSYINRLERLGHPLKSFSIDGIKHYRLLDVVARARAELLAICPPEEKRLALRVEDLRQEVRSLETALSANKHILGLSMEAQKLTGKMLLNAEEIVAGALSYRPICGVYFLIESGRVQYVGQSVNIQTRLRDHAARFDFESFAYIEAERGILDKLESLYIHLLRPEWNGRFYDGTGQATNRCVAPLALDRLLA